MARGRQRLTKYIGNVTLSSVIGTTLFVQSNVGAIIKIVFKQRKIE